MANHHHRLHHLQKRLEKLSRRREAVNEINERFTVYRMGVFVGGFAASLLLYFVWPTISTVLFLLTIIAFTVVVAIHKRVEKSLLKFSIRCDTLRRQIARLTLEWDTLPEANPALEKDHPFAVDLDIVGERSLYRLLNLSISEQGGERLGNWLLDTEPDWQQAVHRQPYVSEISRLPGFRDNLLLTFRQASTVQLDGQTMLEGISGPPLNRRVKWLPPFMTVLGMLNVFLFIMANTAGWPRWWGLTLALYVLFYYVNKETLKKTFRTAFFLEQEINKFRGLLLFLEKYPFRKGSHLANLCKPFQQPDRLPSRQLRGLGWTLAGLSVSLNPLARFLVNIAFPWDFFLAVRLEKFRLRLKKDMPVWLETWTELEALLSLGNFAWLNPGSTMPVILNTINAAEPVLSAEELGHPLIEAAERINNTFAFRSLGELMLITGSNMAGKSTFLKTVGMNLVLAAAGGAVLANRFQSRPFSLFASIKVSDSVTDGFSYFYAEVRRLKALLDRLSDSSRQPLVLLIDEIFRGTNNRERYSGSKSYIKALAGRNGIGLISTHDLELTRLEEKISQLKNYHFRESVESGEMVFDYRLRPGPCPTTNALVIMKLEGLPVEDDDS